MAGPILRIYYESLEQATHFAAPLVKRAKGGAKLDIQYVRARWSRMERSGPIAAFLDINSPDLLLTTVVRTVAGEREFPLLAMEFSEAVKTEDHELQRATVAAASRYSGIPAVKISGERQSAAEHGGNKAFDPFVAVRMFRNERCAARYFYQEWPSLDGRLVVQEDALVCPNIDAVPVVRALVEAVVAVSIDPQLPERTTEEACAAVVAAAEGTDALRSHRLSVERAVLQEVGLCAAVLGADRVDVTHGEWIGTRACAGSDGTLFVKINRFDHSADPDRGVLTALSMSWPGRVIAFYQIAGRGKTKTREALAKIFKESKGVVDAFWGFASDEGLPPWLVDDIKKHKPGRWTPITAHVHANRASWLKNMVLKTLFAHADGMLVQLRRGERTEWFGFEWSREKLMSHADTYFKEFDVRTPLPPIPVVPVDRPNEDEITYVTVHSVLRPNGFRILHVSYPGHQGGEPILNSGETGRTRTRSYVDILSVSPKPIAPTLTESKDKAGAGLTSDVVKLKELRDDTRLRVGLSDLLALRAVSGWDEKVVLLSVAFGNGGKTDWDPKDIDFIVRLNGRVTYDVAPFGAAKRYFTKATSGKTALPPVYTPK